MDSFESKPLKGKLASFARRLKKVFILEWDLQLRNCFSFRSIGLLSVNRCLFLWHYVVLCVICVEIHRYLCSQIHMSLFLHSLLDYHLTCDCLIWIILQHVMMVSGKHGDRLDSQCMWSIYYKIDFSIENEDMGNNLWLTSSISCMNMFSWRRGVIS